MPVFLRHLLVLILLLGASTPAYAKHPLAVAPAKMALDSPWDGVQLQVTKLPDTANGNPDATRGVQYRSLQPAIVSVDQSGWVTPKSNGVATIEVRQGENRQMVDVVVAKLQQKTSFRHDVVPTLARAGCSSGGCHAAQYGQGGLKLSLLGFAPESDHTPLVRDAAQRRLSLIQPEDSLILKKATLEAGHGGGKRFVRDSLEYRILHAWIKQGADGPARKERQIVDLVVTPADRTYQAGDTQQLRVEAVYDDGKRRDVTRRVMYDSMSAAVAEVTSTGFVTATGSGQTAIMLRYMGQAKISTVVVPYSTKIDVSKFEPRNFIDQHVLQRWRDLGLQPAEVCSDHEFIRRAFLDAIGQLPTAAEIDRFVTSKSPAKRTELIDELLGLTGDPKRDVHVDQFSAYWALKWGDLIRNNRNKLGDGGMWALYNWLRSSLRENKPVDQFVRELITAQGSVFESGPANYYKITSKPDELAEATAQIFLGVRLQCAKCHHHPFEVYSQADYYSLASFFTQVKTKSSPDFGALGGDTVVMVNRSGRYLRHPRTRKRMPPTPLLGKPIEGTPRDLRRPLAEWLTSSKNRLFSRNIVNRFWGYTMGTGLVEPIDDMRATNPASNEPLLNALADYLVKTNFDQRLLLKAIMTSATYERSARPAPGTGSDTRFYTHYNVRRLPAEVLLDAIDHACGTQEKFSGIPSGTKAVELPDPNFSSYFLDTMGRPKRVVACECERTTAPNLGQILHVANGDVLSGKVANSKGRIARILKTKATDDEVIRELYLATFCRPPSGEDIKNAKQVVAAATNRKEGLEDLLWALCNGKEFLLNH